MSTAALRRPYWRENLPLLVFGVLVLVLELSAAWLPQWATFLITVAAGRGLVVLGLLLLFRAGLVSFGQGLYFCLGAYTVGLIGTWLKLHDALLLFSSAARWRGRWPWCWASCWRVIAASSLPCCRWRFR